MAPPAIPSTSLPNLAASPSNDKDPPTRKRNHSEAAQQAMHERLSKSRNALLDWDRKSVVAMESYKQLIAATNCPYCPNTLCAECPHFSMRSVSAWIAHHGYRGKSSTMTFDLLSKEITGVIKTRRVDGISLTTFMGITRFIVTADKREEFNRGAMPEWWGFECKDPIYKNAVESWRFLGWTCMYFPNVNGITLFVFDARLREDKLISSNVRSSKDREKYHRPYANDMATLRRVIVRGAMAAELELFGGPSPPLLLNGVVTDFGSIRPGRDKLDLAEYINRRTHPPPAAIRHEAIVPRANLDTLANTAAMQEAWDAAAGGD